MEKLKRPQNWPPGTIEELCALLAWAEATAHEAIRRARQSEFDARAALQLELLVRTSKPEVSDP
jgi:hypothetical protein